MSNYSAAIGFLTFPVILTFSVIIRFIILNENVVSLTLKIDPELIKKKPEVFRNRIY